MEFTGITFAGAGQDLDTGAKVVYAAPHTTSHISTKSIARDGGVSNFRSSVVVLPNAAGSKSSVSCESLMLDDRSRSDTIPAMDIAATPWMSAAKPRSAASGGHLLPDEPRHDRGGRPRPDRRRLCRSPSPRSCRWNTRWR